MKAVDLIKKKLTELAGRDKNTLCDCGRSQRCACCKQWVHLGFSDKYRLCRDCGFFIGQLMSADTPSWKASTK